MKVFLGGTCGHESKKPWRPYICSILKCEYFDPELKHGEWTEQRRLLELDMRAGADYVLYVLTSDMDGVYSIAECIDDSNKRPQTTLLCILYDGFSPDMARSLRAMAALAGENGARVFPSLDEAAEFLNAANGGRLK